MKIMTSKLVLLRWLVGLAVAVMVSGCILPPPWMRELDPWALTNMTPDERPAEEIDWIEFEVEVSEHVKRVVVYGIVYNNGNRSCDSWALDKGGSLLLGEGSSKFIVPSCIASHDYELAGRLPLQRAREILTELKRQMADEGKSHG